MHRFFLPLEAFLGQPPDRILLRPGGRDLVHQIGTVLRLRPGENITALDGQGNAYIVQLESVERKEVRGRIQSTTSSAPEPLTLLSLYASPLRRENFEWVLQKGTELGVGRFVPLLCSRSVDRPKASSERWGRILVEAAEQSGRSRVPQLAQPLPFAAALHECAPHGLLFHEQASQPLNASVLATAHGQVLSQPAGVGLFTGPEGGFTPDEVDLAVQAGLRVLSLGPRVLRAETAAISAVTLAMYLLGELDRGLTQTTPEPRA